MSATGKDFKPATVRISAGEKVKWIEGAGTHTVTFNDGLRQAARLLPRQGLTQVQRARHLQVRLRLPRGQGHEGQGRRQVAARVDGRSARRVRAAPHSCVRLRRTIGPSRATGPRSAPAGRSSIDVRGRSRGPLIQGDMPGAPLQIPTAHARSTKPWTSREFRSWRSSAAPEPETRRELSERLRSASSTRGGESNERSGRGSDHGLFVGDRRGDGAAAARRGDERLRDRTPARGRRRARARRVQDARPRRHERGLDGRRRRRGRGGRGRGRSARQQRRLQPVGRRRDAADGAAAGAVRDQRLRPRPPLPARPSRDAPGRRAGGSST